ncbi:MAG TPA: hypothetical protein VH020_14960 [Stellaceae bacterium]|jgi:hypothetical protein|nr:hypothetical protein [Stellaceae bacterium]
MKTLPTLAAALSFVISAGPALAGSASYVGNWPVTVTHSTGYNVNGTYCLTLTDYGGASLSGGFGNPTDGTFQLIARTLVATIAVPVGTGGFDYLVFVAPASHGNLAKGILDYAGFPDLGKIAFGRKGGC